MTVKWKGTTPVQHHTDNQHTNAITQGPKLELRLRQCVQAANSWQERYLLKARDAKKTYSKEKEKYVKLFVCKSNSEYYSGPTSFACSFDAFRSSILGSCCTTGKSFAREYCTI